MDLNSYRLNTISSSKRVKWESWHGHNRNSVEWVQKAQEGGGNLSWRDTWGEVLAFYKQTGGSEAVGTL